jgi:hypothetical protein
VFQSELMSKEEVAFGRLLPVEVAVAVVVAVVVVDDDGDDVSVGVDEGADGYELGEVEHWYERALVEQEVAVVVAEIVLELG